MQHSINNLLQRQEQIRIIVIAQADANLVAAVDVQAEQVAFGWQELGQDLDAPASLAHDRFDGRGDFAAGEVLVAVEERLEFFELGGVVALDTGGSAFFRSPVAA
jgi:hypothetical protein